LLLACAGLLLVAAAGVVAGGENEATAVVSEGVELNDDSGSVEIDETLRNSGETEAIVVLSESDSATSVAELQAHASESQADLRRFAAGTDSVTIEKRFWLTNAVLVRIDTDEMALDALARVDGVEAIRRNVEFGIQTGATAPQEGVSARTGTVTGAQDSGSDITETDTTYGLEQIGVPEAWSEYNTKGEGASIAVLDTGADPDHPDIDVAKWAEFDGDGNEISSSPYDPNYHGTHVSGTATGGNASGTAIGVAPEADLYAGKVLNADGSGTFAQIVAGMEWAVEENADIMSMSLGAKGYYDIMIEPVQNAENAGTTVVAAVGNDGEETSGSPSNVYSAIAVGASDVSEDIAFFSGGEEIDTDADWGESAPVEWPESYVVPSVAAPGVAVTSALPGGDYGELDGTSMATPHVSGVVALIESVVEDDIDPDTVETVLEETATKPLDAPAPPGERDTRYGSGIVDTPAAVGAFDEGVTAVFDHDPLVPFEDESVTFDASESRAFGGEIVEYRWDFTGNGTVDQVTDQPIVEYAFGTAGQYNVTLEIEDDDGETAQTVEPVTVWDPDDPPPEPNFAVTNVSTNSPVDAGNAVAVDIEVTNTGNVVDIQTLTLDVPGLGNSSDLLELNASESTVTTLLIGTDGSDTGTYEATIQTENDQQTASVAVVAPELELQSISFPSAIDSVDEPLSVEYTIENVGTAPGTESAVDLMIDDTDDTWDVTDNDVTVQPGETVNGTLTYYQLDDHFSYGDTVSYMVKLYDWGDSESGETVIDDAPELDLQSISYPDTVAPNGTLDVEYTIENTDDQPHEESFVKLVVDGLGRVDTHYQVAVEPGETETGTLTFGGVGENFEDGDTVGFAVELQEFNDTATGETTVEETTAQPNITLQDIEYPETVTPAESLTVAYTLVNSGNAAGTESVDLAVEGTDESVDDTDQNVTVAPGGTENGTLTFDGVGEAFESGDTIAFTVELGDAGDSASGSTAVADDSATFEVDIVETTAPVVGEDLVVTATVENVGGLADTRMVALDAGPLGGDETEMNLNAGESVEATFTVETHANESDYGVYNVTVTSTGHTDTATVEVRLPPLPGHDDSPRDIDGNDRYEDIDGNGLLDIFDVQALFSNLDSSAVQNHSDAFDFQMDGEADILDVQTLFDQLG
jgi:subtilisin family serine protease